MAAALAQARRTLREIRAANKSGGQSPAEPTEDDRKQSADGDDDAPVRDLLELRADPLGADIRILFAVEPAGTATLLAALDGPDAIEDHRDEAISLAGGLLTEIRDGNWPPAETDDAEIGEVCFDDAATLLAKLFPDRSTAIRARAAELAELGTLADLRQERELSIADIAASTGRRGMRSARAPPTGASRPIGRNAPAATSAAQLACPVREITRAPTATVCIHEPTFDTRLADHSNAKFR